MLPRKSLSARLAEFKQRKPKVCGPYMTAPPVNTKGAFFYLESDFMPGMRWQYCDEISNGFGSVINHKGWFCDEFEDETIRGIVMRLPSDRGFIVGWTMGEDMASELDTGSVYDDEISAAYAADSMAQYVAEKERDYRSSLSFQMED